MSDTQADGELQCISSPRITGADIPEELFEHILWHITHDRYGRIFAGHQHIDPPSKHLRVHTLTSLILVCKYFARICRPTLYRKVVLRNRQQLRGLLDLLDNGCAPFGKSLVTFTQSLCIEGGEDTSLWVHQLGTVLLPRMKDAGMPFPLVKLAVKNDPAGPEPFRTQLPRILPPSLYQHISELRLESARFKGSEDLLRYLSSFRSLRSLCFSKCTCGIGAMQPTFPRPSRHLPFPKTTLDGSSSVFPAMASSLLDWYARVNSVPYLLHGQAEMLTVAHIMEEFCIQLLRRGSEPSSMYSGMSRICSIPRPSIVVEIGSRHGLEIYSSYLLRLSLVLRDTTHYDIVIRDYSKTAYRASRAMPGLLYCIKRFPHLETLRWIFSNTEETEAFVGIAYSQFQRMLSAGQKMKVGYAATVDEEPSDWEPIASILRRVASKIKTEASADQQASEATAKENKNVPETDADRPTESTEPASELAKDASTHAAIAQRT